MTVLPWIAIGLVLVAFSLADELPDPRVRRVVGAGAGALLLGAAALQAAGMRGADVAPVAVAAGPLAFLLAQEGLRRLFRAWKGEEPVLADRGARSGSRRIWFEPEAARSVGFRDYLYTFLVGMAMLLCAGPAIAEIVARGG